MNYLEPKIKRNNDKNPLVTILTATIGNYTLERTIESIQNQTYKNIQHIIIIDGDGDRKKNSLKIIEKFNNKNINILKLPYSIGTNNYLCHRIYGLGSFLAKGDFIGFLNDNDFYDSNHIESNINNVLKNNLDWSYSLRKIVDENGKFVCNDDCESLGKWNSFLSPMDYLIDVNCYFLSKKVAIHITPIWYRKFREKDVPDVDRTICKFLLENYKNFNTTYEYTVNYTAGSTQNSVKKDFFLKGNSIMELKHISSGFPWNKKK